MKNLSIVSLYLLNTAIPLVPANNIVGPMTNAGLIKMPVAHNPQSEEKTSVYRFQFNFAGAIALFLYKYYTYYGSFKADGEGPDRFKEAIDDSDNWHVAWPVDVEGASKKRFMSAATHRWKGNITHESLAYKVKHTFYMTDGSRATYERFLEDWDENLSYQDEGYSIIIQ